MPSQSRDIEWTNTQNSRGDGTAKATAVLFMVCMAFAFIVLGGSLAYWIISELSSVSLSEIADGIAGFRVQ